MEDYFSSILLEETPFSNLGGRAVGQKRTQPEARDKESTLGMKFSAAASGPDSTSVLLSVSCMSLYLMGSRFLN